MTNAERDKYSMINFEETELRLGLPGGSAGESSSSSSSSSSRLMKRGFSETETTTDHGRADVDLKLNLSSSSNTTTSASPVTTVDHKAKEINTITTAPPPPRAKAQVVGWPPVRSFRKNIVNNKSVEKSSSKEETAATTTTTSTATATVAGSVGAYVKVSVDGAPYLRKVDLKMYKTYKELSDALAKMFMSTSGGKSGSHNTSTTDEEERRRRSKLMDLLNGSSSEYVPTYEDKDGDWMLVGDVPWEMFVESCKRLRIMKASEAIGFTEPRAVDKCKSIT